MQNNVKNVELLKNKEQTVYYFDKDGNRKEKTVKITDRYLVTLTNGDSVVLSKAELKFHGIVFKGIVEPAADIVEEFEDIDDDLTKSDEDVASNPSK